MTERNSVFGRSRRSFLTATGAAGALAVAGCLGSADSDDETVSFLLNPAEDNIDIELQYRPIVEYLEDDLDVEIETTQNADYAATFTELESGRGDFADTSPSAIVATEEFADVLGMRKAYGAEKYFSLITTPVESDVHTLGDLEGEEVALGSPLSVSSGLVPTLMLQQGGLDIGDMPGGEAGNFTARFTNDHFTALNSAMEDAPIKAACTGAFAAASHVPQEQFDEMSQDFVEISSEYPGAGEDRDDQELRLLAVSEPIPRAPIMVRSDWEHPKREEIEETILDLPEEAFQHDEERLAEDLGVDPDTEAGQEEIEGHQIWFDDVVEASADDFQLIRDVLDELGLEFEDIN